MDDLRKHVLHAMPIVLTVVVVLVCCWGFGVSEARIALVLGGMAFAEVWIINIKREGGL